MADGGIITEIPQHIRDQFASEWTHQQQLMESQFAAAGIITEPRWTSKDFYFDMLEPIEWEERNGRHEDTNPDEVQGSKVRGTKRYFRMRPKLFDNRDAKWLDTLPRPDGEVMQAAKYGFERLLDRRIVAAAVEPKWVGPDDNQTLVPFPTANEIPANYVASGSAVNSDITMAKLFALEMEMRKKSIDPLREDVYLAISPKQLQTLQLLAMSSTTDPMARLIQDWVDKRGSKEAKLLGIFKVIITNDLPTVTGTTDIRRCPVWVRKAFTQGTRNYSTHIDVLANRSHSVQLAAYDEIGVVRRSDDYVLHMLCDEQP